MECWAKDLGNCGGATSREHYISDGIFDGQSITAFGLSWCSEAPVSIGLASATAQILCKRHNEALSDYDDEASKLSRFMTTNIINAPRADEATTLKGPLLEKWSLKTLLNLGFLGALDRPLFTRIEPPLEIVQCLFRNIPVPEGAGLYLVSGTLTTESYKVGLAWNAIRNRETSKVFGMAFTFNGLRFVVSLLSSRGEDKIKSLGVTNGFDYASANVTYRPHNITLAGGNAGRKTIHLVW